MYHIHLMGSDSARTFGKKIGKKAKSYKNISKKVKGAPNLKGPETYRQSKNLP